MLASSLLVVYDFPQFGFEIAAQLTLGTGEAVRSKHHRWADVKQRYIDDVVSLKRFEDLLSPRNMGDVTTAAIGRFKAIRSKQKSRRTGNPLSAATINKDLRNLKAFVRKAMRWKVLAEVPDIEMLDTVEVEKPTHTDADLRALLQHCDAATMPNHLPTYRPTTASYGGNR